MVINSDFIVYDREREREREREHERALTLQLLQFGG
jgi:hypothetical protein